jgi:lipopolysaccharide transport system permease protein
LAKHDLKDRYRRSLLGIAWSLIKPALMTLILTVVFTNVFDVSIREYAPFLFLGILAWQFLTESVLQGCNSFRLGNTFLRVRPIPVAIFPLRVVLSAGIHALIGLGAAIVAIWYFQGAVHPLALLTILPGMLIFALAAWALAAICAIMHTLYADTQQIAEISLQALFYATPVIYMPESLNNTGWLHTLVECNPFASFLELVRRPLLHGELPGGQSVLIATAFTGVMACIACVALHRVEKRLVMWL